MVFVNGVLMPLASSERYEQDSVWAKIFIDSVGELPGIFFSAEKLHFVLLEPFTAINKSSFTQLLVSMKFRTQCPKLCRVDSALQARERKLA